MEKLKLLKKMRFIKNLTQYLVYIHSVPSRNVENNSNEKLI